LVANLQHLDDELAPGILVRKRRSVAIIATIATHFPVTVEVSGQAVWRSSGPIDVP